jgi:hypothetical protein
MDPMPSCNFTRSAMVLWSLVLGLTFVTAAGCGPSDERIASWRTDPDGAAKLLAAVKDPSLAPARRAHAAAVLVEMGAGVDMESAVAGFDVAERAAVVPYLIPRLVAWLDLPDPTRSGDARDALYALREQSPTEQARKAIDAALLPALIKDVRAGRERAGRSLIKTILIDIGTPTIPLLTPLLEDPAVPLATPVEVIDKVADVPAKETAAAALVRRAQALQQIPEALWAALPTLGGKQAAEFLQKAVEKGTEPDAERAANALIKMRRVPGIGLWATRLIEAESTAEPLRELLFQVAEKDGSEETGKALVAMFGSDRARKDRAFRKRSLEAIFKSAPDGKLILPALEALPLDYRFDPKEWEDEIVGPISARPGFETRRPFFRALKSKSPIARLVAVLGLEKMGFYEDADRIAELSNDRGAVRGLPAGEAIGPQARRATAALRKTAPPGAADRFKNR